MPRQHIEIIDGREYVVTTLPQDWRCTPSQAQESALEPTHRSPEDGRDSQAQAESQAEAQEEALSERGAAHVGLTGRSGPLSYKRR